jgi:hypothetical protein
MLRVIEMLAVNEKKLSIEEIDIDHRVIKCLGRGGEGIVYLIQENDSKQKFVVKVYHKPHERIWSTGLEIYEQNVDAPELGLSPITLIGDTQVIQAIKVPYTPLHEVHWRLLYYSENIAKAMFRSFCKMQYYLMTGSGICLLDSTTNNLMLDYQGRFHFVDFGWLVHKIESARVTAEGRLGYGVAMLLLNVYNRNIKHSILPSTGYSYDTPCVYFAITDFDELASEHNWVTGILKKVRSTNGSSFLNPEFYLELSAGFPERVAFPRLVRFLGNSFRTVRSLS